MNNQTNPEAIATVLKGVSLVNPIAGFFLDVAWNFVLKNKASELGLKLKDYEEKSGDEGWKVKAVGVFRKILPDTAPPKDQDEAELLLKNLSYDNFKGIEENFTNFLTAGNDKEFLENLKKKFGTDNSWDALKLFFKIKELFVSREIFEEFSNLRNLREENSKKLGKQLRDIDKKFEANLKQLERKNFTLDEGFYILSPVYFEHHKSKGIGNWIEGWKFSLIDVYLGLDYKRKIVDEIEKEGNFLISGESGYSKSTTLYRVICDYYKRGYSIVVSIEDLGGGNLENPQKIVEVIEDLLEEGKVLVAVDDVQYKPKAFEIIKKLEDNFDFDKIKFVYTARIPEFNDLHISQKKYQYNFAEIDYCLEKLMIEKKIENFDPEEAEYFIKKYYPKLKHDNETLEIDLTTYSQMLYEDSDGNPIILKYLLTQDGIKKHIEKQYADYIFDNEAKKANPSKLKGTLFSCILDWCGLQITNDLADKCGFNLRPLKDSILKYNEQNNTWKTMHPIWDKEFIIFWYNMIKDEVRPTETVKEIIKTIIDVKDEEIIYNLMGSLSTIVLYIDDFYKLFEPSIIIPEYLNDLYKARLYAFGLGGIYIEKDPIKALILMDKGLNIFERLIKNNENLKTEFTGILNNKTLALVALGDFEGALESVNKALEINPNYEDALNKKGFIMSFTDPLNALKIIDKALEINPKSEDALNNKGLTLINLERYDDALNIFDYAIEINPNNADFWYNKGLSYNYLKNYEKAVKSYNKALELDPQNVNNWNNKGLCLYNLGLLEKSLDMFNRALELDSSIGYVWYNKGNVCFDMKNYEEAIKCYNKALEIDPQDLDILNKKGSAFDKLGNHLEAQKCFAMTWLTEAFNLLMLEQYEEAIHNIDKAIGINPLNPEAWYLKGLTTVSYESVEKYQEGIEYLDKALELDHPLADKILNLKGLCLFNLGEFNKALKCYEEAININANYVEPWDNKGNALFHLREPIKALDSYDNALSIDTNYINAWINKGLTLFDLGDYQEAIECYNSALQIDESTENIYLFKGLAIYELGNYKQALEEYETALKINPEYLEAWNEKGRCLSSLGEYQKALESFETALKIDPNFELARENREHILRILRQS